MNPLNILVIGASSQPEPQKIDGLLYRPIYIPFSDYAQAIGNYAEGGKLADWAQPDVVIIDLDVRVFAGVNNMLLPLIYSRDRMKDVSIVGVAREMPTFELRDIFRRSGIFLVKGKYDLTSKYGLSAITKQIAFNQSGDQPHHLIEQFDLLLQIDERVSRGTSKIEGGDLRVRGKSGKVLDLSPRLVRFLRPFARYQTIGEAYAFNQMQCKTVSASQARVQKVKEWLFEQGLPILARDQWGYKWPGVNLEVSVIRGLPRRMPEAVSAIDQPSPT